MKLKNLLVFTLSLSVTLSVHTSSAQTQIWGTSQNGGANSQGSIWMADGNGNNIQTVYSLVNATGAMPLGNMVLAGNHKLYGVTELGGCNDSCVCYNYDPNTGIFTDFWDLDCNQQFGYGTRSGMIAATDGKLYGVNPAGGTAGYGVIYSVDPVTDTYTDIYDIGFTNGHYPLGMLVQLPNGLLYGMTNYGGTNNLGTLFSYDIVNNIYTDLHQFDFPTGGGPLYGGLIQATDGKLYGMTFHGGADSLGVIFSFDLSNNTYTDVYNFDGVHGDAPEGGLIQASNGLLYGMTNDGGIDTLGVLFSFDISTHIYTDLVDFDGVLHGASPTRDLAQTTNGKLFGTTLNGGLFNMGIAFSYDILTNTLTKLIDFDATIGRNPDCSMIETPVLVLGQNVITNKSPLQIFPNPAQNIISISGEVSQTIDFIDVLGQRLTSLKINSSEITTIDISNFPNIFFVKTSNEIKKIIRVK